MGNFEAGCDSIKPVQLYPPLSSVCAFAVPPIAHSNKKKISILDTPWMYMPAAEVSVSHEWFLKRSSFSVLDEEITVALRLAIKPEESDG